MLAFFDVKQPVTIQTDASQSGLGACLMQRGKPVAYASRAMTRAEQNYAQIEKEILAICFATSKFHQYFYGKSAVNVQTDHKPLESILKKPLCKAPPILQRLMLRLEPYDLDLHYVPGKYMYLADTLSRAYIQGEGNADLEDELNRVVHSIVPNIPVRNRRHLSKTNELPALFVPADQLLTATSVGAPHEREMPAAPPEPVDTQTTQMTHDRVTRSGRVVKSPVSYQ